MRAFFVSIPLVLAATLSALDAPAPQPFSLEGTIVAVGQQAVDAQLAAIAPDTRLPDDEPTAFALALEDDGGTVITSGPHWAGGVPFTVTTIQRKNETEEQHGARHRQTIEATRKQLNGG